MLFRSQPKSDSPLGKDLTKDGKSEATAAAKGKAADAKDKSDKSAAKAKDKAPVTLKPTDELKQ